MADIALVFGWTVSDMADMDVEELTEWRERARIRYVPDE